MVKPWMGCALALLWLAACADDGSASDDAGSSASDDAGAQGMPDATAASDDAKPAPVEPTPVPAVPPEVMEHAGDWPLPNLDYDNTRASFTAAIDSGNVDQLRELWRHPVGPPAAFGAVTANPLVLGDTVYIQDMSSNIAALELNSGAPRWEHAIGEQTVGPNGVAVGWGKLFANHGDTGMVALDLDDGDELWRFEPRLVASEGIDIQPSVHGGLVYMSTVPASLRGFYLGGGRGVIHALAHDSGLPVWSFDTVDSSDIWGDAALNSGGGAWYPPLIDLRRELLYFGTGNPAPFPGTAAHPSGSSRPGDNLYSSSLIALEREGGALRWYQQERAHDLFDWDFQNAPMLVEGDAGQGAPDLVIGSGKTGTVVAYDADTGERVWRVEVGVHQNTDVQELPRGEPLEVYPGVLGGVLTATAYADGVVYVPVVNLPTLFEGDSYALPIERGVGELVALDAGSGAQLWSQPLEAPCYGAATVVNDLVLTSDAEGRIHAFERTGGEPVWSYEAHGGINAPLAVAGDVLLVPVGVGPDPALVALSL
jgi:glucose dehydrogenase